MKLFESGQIGSMKLKNRIFMAPMGSSTEDLDGGFSREAIDYFAERAKGGCGMIMVSACVSKELEGRLLFCLDSEIYRNRLEKFIEEIHSYGAKVCIQLLAGFGRVGGMQPGTFKPTSASEVPYMWAPDVTCRALTKDEIKRLVESYGKAAALSKACGADCVEIHGYGGYLIDQFMSEIWNKRTDEYGGSFENRMRFPIELMDAVRANCGTDFPIIFKMTPCHYIPGGRELEEGIRIAKMLEEYGVAAIQVDAGSYETHQISLPTAYAKRNYQLELSAEIKKAVSIPILSSGQLGDPGVAEKGLNDGIVDYVGLGRSVLADPYWANKVKANREDDVIPCIRCNEGCLGRVSQNFRIGCSVNPLTGKESYNRITPVDEKKKVLVIGGGPGGVEAALTAMEQGHEVELWEKADTLGGNLIAAAAPDFKVPVKNLLNYYRHQCEKRNVKISFLKEASAEEIIGHKADLVILATGSSHIIPKIPGIDQKSVTTAVDVLKGKASIGEKIVVVGAGLVGMETALHLLSLGKQVTVIEMKDRILPEPMFETDVKMLNELIAESGMTCKVSTMLCEIKDGSVVAESPEGREEINCDTVVLALGFRSNNALQKELEGKVPEVVAVGDAVSPRKVLSAVWESYYAIRALNESIKCNGGIIR